MKKIIYDEKKSSSTSMELWRGVFRSGQWTEWMNHESLKSRLKLKQIYQSISVFILLFISSICLGQTQSFRLEINNLNDVPSVNQGPNESLILNFDNTTLQQIFDNYNITGFEKEFPLFPDVVGLKDIYLVSTGNNQLFVDLNSLDYFPIIEKVEESIELGLPPDYVPSLRFTAIDLPGAYNITEGSPAIKIGVLDTQLPILTSPALVDLIDELEYIGPVGIGTTPYNANSHAHGVTVASIVGATPDNGIGGGGNSANNAGIGYKCGLYYGLNSLWTLGIQEFASRGVRVVNMSFTNGCTYSSTAQLFITKLAEKGIILVVAAGNGDIETAGRIFDNGAGGTTCSVQGRLANCNPAYTGNANGYLYPASYDDVISVTTMDNDAEDLYLNYNIPVPCTVPFYVNGTFTHNDKVDIICPTGSAWPRIATSYAAPVISGVVGLMLSVNPNLDVNEAIDILKLTGTDIHLLGSNPIGPFPDNRNYYQNGITTTMNPLSQFKLEDNVPLVNAQAAVLEAKTRYDDFLANQTNTPLYTKQLTGSHVNDEMESFGAQWVDYDNDNDLDIYNEINKLGTGNTAQEMHMYENLCMGSGDFVNMDIFGLDNNNEKQSNIGWGDVNNDGYKDVMTFGTAGELYLYTNNAGNSFTQSLVGTIPATHAGPSPPENILRGARISDFNNDGNLDFIIGYRFGGTSSASCFVFEGDGNGNFSQVTGNTSDLYLSAHGFYNISVGDLNNDGFQDIATCGVLSDYHIYFGDGAFNFADVPLGSVPYQNFGSYEGNIIDYDNDGDLDVYYFAVPTSVLLNNQGNGNFEYVEDLIIVTDAINPNGHATWGDYDNDGDLDLYAPGLQNKYLYRSYGGVTFERVDFEVTNNSSEANHESLDAAFGDIDNDGDLDLYVNNFFNDDLNNYLYENDVNDVNNNSWITLKLEGDPGIMYPNGKNTSVSAEGAIVRASVVDLSSNPSVTCRQMRHVQTNEGIPHDIYFGFGDYTGNIQIEITWPSGLVQTIGGVAVNNRYKIIEAQGIVDIGCACTPGFPIGRLVSGTIGYDLNQDCNCDDDGDGLVDFPLNDIFVQITQDLNGAPGIPNVYYAQTDPNGYYEILLPGGTLYNIVPYLAGTAYIVSNNCAGNPANLPPNEYNILLGFSSTGNDFCLTSNNCDVDISLYPVYQNPASGPCPGIQQEVCMTLVNNGSSISNPVFTLDFDDSFINVDNFTTSCGTATLDAGSNTITVNSPLPLDPQGTCTICVTYTVDPSTPLGTTLVSTGEINGQCQELETMTEVVNCAFDPNDKLLVNPQSCGPENNIQKDELLLYRVRFQNEGNANAVNIAIKDFLDEDLDLSTFHMMSSSHTVTNVSVIPGNKLIVEMNGIQLPPKSLDEPGSKGFILFGIKAKPNVPEGTIVDNVASIYFDLNEAVVTNAVMNTLREIPSPDVQFESSRTCTSLDISYDFEYTGITPDGATYIWDFGPNATPAISTAANPTGIIFSGPGTESVKLTIVRYGCSDATLKDVDVSSPFGCKGKANKVYLCNPAGNTVCVNINAAQTLINNGNFCVGECSGSKSQEIDELSAVIIYPNPSSGLFNVEVPSSDVLGFTLMNSLGQEIESRTIDADSFTIRLNDEPVGVYFLLLETNKGLVVKKLDKVSD